MKYKGGRGSKTGTNILTRCSSSQNFCFRRKYSWCKINSPSTSSTNIQKPSALPKKSNYWGQNGENNVDIGW